MILPSPKYKQYEYYLSGNLSGNSSQSSMLVCQKSRLEILSRKVKYLTLLSDTHIVHVQEMAVSLDGTPVALSYVWFVILISYALKIFSQYCGLDYS